jgi:hypothetical protein
MLHQNRGVLSKNKRELFKELTDEELERLERSFCASFGMDGDHEAASPP